MLVGVPEFAGDQAFGALRCAIDNLNGDNVEWIQFPAGSRHVLCYAYYVTPPPTSGTIIIKKQVASPPNADMTFPFAGNVSYNPGGQFSLKVTNGSTPSITFYRAETRPGDPPWTATELVPDGWRLTGLTCTHPGASDADTDLASATVVDLAGGRRHRHVHVHRRADPAARQAAAVEGHVRRHRRVRLHCRPIRRLRPAPVTRPRPPPNRG